MNTPALLKLGRKIHASAQAATEARSRRSVADSKRRQRPYSHLPLCASETPAERRAQSLKKVLPSQPQTTSFRPVICGQNRGLTVQIPVRSNRPQVPGLNWQNRRLP
jgi:hypothetical protein